MIDSVLRFLSHGLTYASPWQVVLFTLIVTHITIASVTIFLHRHQAHRALELHPVVSHFFRVSLWLTTATVTKEWVAVHRKHHARCETPEDPHSPKVKGIREVLFRGAELYRAEADRAETLRNFGQGTPADWLENTVYTPHTYKGIALMFAIDVALFGALGITVWAVQMLWIPIFAAGVINGIGHYWGYRNHDCADASTNIVPWGILIGGEELHNNHHAFAQSARLSSKFWELDIGWYYIQALQLVGLARVRKVAPKPRLAPVPKAQVDLESLQAILAYRYDLAAAYAKSLRKVCREEAARLRRAHSPEFKTLKQARKWLGTDASRWTDQQRAKAAQAVAASDVVRKLVEMRASLNAIWERQTTSRAELVAELQTWCNAAEQSGIEALERLSLRVRCYAV